MLQVRSVTLRVGSVRLRVGSMSGFALQWNISLRVLNHMQNVYSDCNVVISSRDSVSFFTVLLFFYLGLAVCVHYQTLQALFTGFLLCLARLLI